MTKLTSLAGFRRFLATPGATVQVTRHDWATKDGFNGATLFEPRKVKKLQTNAVCFEDGKRGSWLYWDRGKTGSMHFDGSDLVTVDLNAAKGEVMQYRCWIEETAQ
jgi:hypothetical protein